MKITDKMYLHWLMMRYPCHTLEDEYESDKKAMDIFLKLGHSPKEAFEAYKEIFPNANEKRFDILLGYINKNPQK